MWVLFFPQLLLKCKNPWEVKGMILFSYLTVPEKLVHAVGFIRFGKLKGEKSKNLTVFFLFNISIFIFFHKYSTSKPESISLRNPSSWWYLQNIYHFSKIWLHMNPWQEHCWSDCGSALPFTLRQCIWAQKRCSPFFTNVSHKQSHNHLIHWTVGSKDVFRNYVRDLIALLLALPLPFNYLALFCCRTTYTTLYISDSVCSF